MAYRHSPACTSMWPPGQPPSGGYGLPWNLAGAGEKGLGEGGSTALVTSLLLSTYHKMNSFKERTEMVVRCPRWPTIAHSTWSRSKTSLLVGLVTSYFTCGASSSRCLPWDPYEIISLGKRSLSFKALLL